MLFAEPLARPTPLRAAIRMDETRRVGERLAETILAPDARGLIDATTPIAVVGPHHKI